PRPRRASRVGHAGGGPRRPQGRRGLPRLGHGAGLMLEISDLVVAYGAVEALHGGSLEVAKGEIGTLVGANGRGKTTLLRAISGLLAPKSGEIALEGVSLVGRPAHAIVAKGLAHVPEGRRIFTGLTVRENLDMGAYVVRSRKETAERLERVLALFPRLE